MVISPERKLIPQARPQKINLNLGNAWHVPWSQSLPCILAAIAIWFRYRGRTSRIHMNALARLACHGLIYGGLFGMLIRHAVFGVDAVGSDETLVGEQRMGKLQGTRTH